ncbi:MAG: SPOR domain-containing protein [Alphaproteobacteria bacterium]|nr:SPOR domain-containing protein [Alphaproteobacteria bacterium]
MFKEFYGDKDEDYLSEFRQKIASERQAQLQARRQELQRSRNGFIGTVAGIALAAVVSWVLLVPHFHENKNIEIPVIRRPITPVKIQPNNPGGMEILNQDKPVYALVEKHEANTIKIESILPTPETPKLPEIVPEPEIKTVENIEEQQIIQDDILPIKNLDELIEKVETTDNKKIEIPQKPANINLEVKTAQENKKEPVEVTIKQAQSSSISKGSWQLQLLASSDADSVKKSWNDLSKKHNGLKNQPYEIEESKLDNGNMIYRLKAGNFDSKDKADKLCSELKTEGLNCFAKQK